MPVGTGMWIAGGNDDVVRNNRFYNNWRRGTMLFAVPDQTVCGPNGFPQAGCNSTAVPPSTSYDDKWHDNVMGIAPDGSYQPNGTDFWWDSFPGNTGNCWFDNTTAANHSITTSPDPLPDCNGGKDPSSSVGTGSANEAELGQCLVGFSAVGYDPSACPWFKTPAKPGP
jgi:hypothetical protein